MTAAGYPYGSAAFSPERVTAGSWGSYRITYRVGPAPLTEGATVRIQLPDSWHAWRRNGAKGVQSHDPRADNYVTARVAAGDAVIRCEVEGGVADAVVKSNRVGIDGRAGRYVYVARVTVVAGQLREGDRIEVAFGDRSGGSRGFAAALHPQGPELVAIAVDADGSGDEQLLPAAATPVVSVRPGEPFEALAYAASVLAVGESTRLRIVVVDREGNRVDGVASTPRVVAHHGAAEIGSVRRGDLPGTFSAEFTPTEPGVLRLRVSVTGLADVLTNPTWVSVDAPAERLFWGDLHSHADHSFDGIGRYPYEYARDVSCLDFYCLTEHCEGWRDGDWQYLTDQVGKYHQPGEFVVFPGYEATFPEPWGHHNVYFRDPEDRLVFGANDGTVLDLWQALRDRRALTIPHHTGVAFSPMTAGNIPGSTSPAVDWSHHDAEFRRAVEIYSGHGQSEFYDPLFDLSYENSDFSTNTSREGPHYARDAWEHGHQLGVIASSDNHRAQPGRTELGLAAVFAPARDRGELFDALHDRRSYGTTGARILLDFTVDGVAMGQRAPYSPDPTCRVRTSGTASLESVEIFRGEPGVPGSIRRVAAWDVAGLDFDGAWRDEDSPPADTRVYYARVRQRTPYRGRKPTAWSSPIWVDRPDPCAGAPTSPSRRHEKEHAD